MSDCTICTELSSGEPPAIVAHHGGRIRWLANEWALAPSLGPVSPAHVLLLPRAHCQFSLTADDALPFIEGVAEALRRETPAEREVVLFEHANSPSGCGVLHAHVHAVAVPRGFDVRCLFGTAAPRRIDSLDNLAAESSELAWCSDGGGSIWAAVGARIASQTGRRAVAKANAATFDADWKAYTHAPWFESSRRVAEQLSQVLRRQTCLDRPAA